MSRYVLLLAGVILTGDVQIPDGFGDIGKVLIFFATV
jgi:hypothetical protein